MAEVHTPTTVNLIEPSAWVVNRSLLASGSRHPMLLQRLAGERAQLLRVSTRLAAHTHVIAWQATPPVGVAALRGLTAKER